MKKHWHMSYSLTNYAHNWMVWSKLMPLSLMQIYVEISVGRSLLALSTIKAKIMLRCISGNTINVSMIGAMGDWCHLSQQSSVGVPSGQNLPTGDRHGTPRSGRGLHPALPIPGRHLQRGTCAPACPLCHRLTRECGWSGGTGEPPARCLQ